MKNLLFVISAALLLTSCGGSGFLSRKYTKGIYSESVSKASKPARHDDNNDQAKSTSTSKTQSAPALIYSDKTKEVKETVYYTENTISSKKIATKKQTPTQATTSFKAKNLILPPAAKKFFKKTENNKSKGRSDSNFIVMVILCFFDFINLIPVYFHDSKKITLNFWITLLLDFTYIGGVIFALLVVFDIVSLA